jgi:hypothetical protein
MSSIAALQALRQGIGRSNQSLSRVSRKQGQMQQQQQLQQQPQQKETCNESQTGIDDTTTQIFYLRKKVDDLEIRILDVSLLLWSCRSKIFGDDCIHQFLQGRGSNSFMRSVN